MMKFAVQAVALGVATFASTLTMADEKNFHFQVRSQAISMLCLVITCVV